MKAIILLRVSSKEQEDNHSLEAQESRLLEYCERNQLEQPKIFKVVESSTRGERKQFQKVVEYIKNQPEKVALVIEAIDRLQRGFTESLLFNKMREKEQVELHFVKENLVINENADPTKLLMWDFGVVTAKSYIANLSHNIRRSNEKKLKSGEYIRQAPVGYQNYRDEQGRSQIKVDPVKSVLVKQAFELYATGTYSITKLWNHLQAEGLTISKKNSDVLIARSSVALMLSNKFYTGTMTVKGKEYPHKYETFIEDWLFEKCQEVAHSKNQKTKKEVTKHEYVFKGILRNHATGRLMSGTRKGDKVYYRSPKFGDSPASKNVREEIVLGQVQTLFEQIKIPKTVLKDLQQSLKQTHEAKNQYRTDHKAKLERDLKAITPKLDRLLDAMINGVVTQEEYNAKSKTLKEQQEKLKRKIDNFDDADEQFAITVSYLLEISARATELFERSKPEQKRQLLNMVLSNISLDGENLRYEWAKPFNLIAQSAKRSDWYTR